MKIISLIDTFGYFFRNYYALPKLKSPSGRHTGLLLGFANLIKSLYEDGSSHLVFALEGEGEKVRKTLAPDYKAHRQEPDSALIEQIHAAISWIKMMNLAHISIAGFEADDAIASLKNLAPADALVRIVSADKDFYQLIDSRTFIFDPAKKLEIREAECVARFGVRPSQFIDYQALLGDSSDNVAGIAGVGAKSAQKLIAHFGSLEALYAARAELPAFIGERLAKNIIDGESAAYKSRDLVALRGDLLESFDFESAQKPAQNPLFLIADELNDCGINILSKIAKTATVTQDSADLQDSQDSADSAPAPQTSAKPNIHTITSAAELLEIIQNLGESRVAFALESAQNSDRGGESAQNPAKDSQKDSPQSPAAILFAPSENCIYRAPLKCENESLWGESGISAAAAVSALTLLFEKCEILAYDVKSMLLVLRRVFGVEPQKFSDVMILAWLDSSAQNLALDSLSKRVLGESAPQITSQDSPQDSQKNSATFPAAAKNLPRILSLHAHYQNALPPEILALARELEFPFVRTLAAMEQNGIAVDVAFFARTKIELEARLSGLKAEIFRAAGEEFNVNSARQLAHILFEKLALKKGRTLKNHASTDEKTLESLLGAHEIIALILDYRETAKLLSTYVLAILARVKAPANPKNPAANAANPANLFAPRPANLFEKTAENPAAAPKLPRIHSTFSQTGTATGRLSSKNPNLQNIPVKSQMGRKLREGFVAEDSRVLISADYSQIELRLLAHFSQDSGLLAAFRADKDIHLESAARIFGEENAKEKRNVAKSINFGLIYGMGANALAQTLKTTQREAKDYIEGYFRTFPTVREFLHREEEKILARGYAETLLLRRRAFDFSAAVGYQKAAFLREGVNAIFQGSAADLIKMAMNECAARFCEREVRLLLQIHDELIFEALESEKDAVAAEIKAIMEGVYSLRVPLKCEVRSGKKWSDLK